MSLFVSKQQYQQQPFNRIESSNSSSNRTQQFNLMMSTEETKQLAGLVAKTRALFESNNKSRFINEQHHDTQSAKPRANFVVNRPMRSAMNENDSDKENSYFKHHHHQETFAPFLNQLKPTSKLASKFNNLFNQSSSITSNNTNNLHLPNITPAQPPVNKLNTNNKWILNNQQFKAATPLYSSSSCSASSTSSSSPPPSSLSSHSFESHNEINDCVNMVSSNSPTGLWQVSEELRKEYNLPTSVRQAKMCFERTVQKESCVTSQTNKSKLNESPPPLFSSSSSNASSSIPSSPTSLDNSTRFKTIITSSTLKDDKCIYPFNQTKSNSVNLPSLAPVTPNAANNKIKILKKNFSKISNNNGSFIASQEAKEEVSKSVPNYQKSLDSTETHDSNMTSTASIQIKTFKLKQPEPVVTIKSILRNKPLTEPTLVSSNEPDISPKLNEKYVEKFLEKTADITQPGVKVDQSSCVLPSKLKTKNTNNSNEQTVLKSTTNSFKSWQPKTEINTNNLVKNNPFTITNNANNSNMIKR